MKTVIADVMPEETRLAVLEDGKLRDYAVERDDESHIVNHIYAGTIQNILPALQAAFVNIGRKKNAFIYMGDLFPRAATKEEIQQTRIFVGQHILVQVVKEEQGGKGAKVTANISLPGRYAVLMPTVDYVGVSKKIRQEEERDRLRRIVGHVKPPGMGVIIRTVAEGVTEEALQADITYLLHTWDSIRQRYKLAKKNQLLYREADLVMRTVRDHVTADIEKIIVNHPDTYERIRQVFPDPTWQEKLIHYTGKEPVFEAYHIEDEVRHLWSRQVALPSGGNLIFDYTEALTVIDVNSSKYTGNSTLQETIFHVNKEAAKEIARQLRLRDIGGIILVDFIDMARAEDREAILAILSRETASDTRKTRVMGMTALNLVEITRKKSRQSLFQVQYTPCTVCGGTGYLYAAESVALQIMRRLRQLVRERRLRGDVLIVAHASVLAVMREKKQVARWERELARSLHFEESVHANREVFSILSYE